MPNDTEANDVPEVRTPDVPDAMPKFAAAWKESAKQYRAAAQEEARVVDEQNATIEELVDLLPKVLFFPLLTFLAGVVCGAAGIGLVWILT